jgi:hypothetical protein
VAVVGPFPTNELIGQRVKQCVDRHKRSICLELPWFTLFTPVSCVGPVWPRRIDGCPGSVARARACFRPDQVPLGFDPGIPRGAPAPPPRRRGRSPPGTLGPREGCGLLPRKCSLRQGHRRVGFCASSLALRTWLFSPANPSPGPPRPRRLRGRCPTGVSMQS